MGVAGNQPVYAEAPLRAALPDLDLIRLSAKWEVRKPAAAFFERVAADLACHPHISSMWGIASITMCCRRNAWG